MIVIALLYLFLGILRFRLCSSMTNVVYSVVLLV